jgi:bifunctional aspartokinase / homoserine dehydrogenase 1
MKVMKFGGVLLNNTSGFNEFIEILKEYEQDELVIVVSAFSHTTRELLYIARTAEKGDDQGAYQGLNKLIEYHIRLAEIFLNPENLQSLTGIYQGSQNKIMNYLKGVFITNELTPRTLDIILSYGEYLAINTYDFILKEYNITHSIVDSKEIIITNNEFNEAVPIIEDTQKNVREILLPEISRNKIVLTQGFVAMSLSGEITTMGIESSNLTATLIAVTLDAEELIIWTDVEGIYTADPKLTSKAKFIAGLDYHTAHIAAINGLKLIYPAMIDSAKRKGIKIFYRSAINPKGRFTVISEEPQNESPKIIILSDNLKILKIDLFELGHHSLMELMSLITQKPEKYKYLSFTPDTLTLVLQNEDFHFEELFEPYPVRYFNDYNLLTIINSKDCFSKILDNLNNIKTEKYIFKIESECSNNISRYIIHSDGIKIIFEQLLD